MRYTELLRTIARGDRAAILDAGVAFDILDPHLIFLHRKLGGLFQMLKRLDVTLDLRPYWDQTVG
jgi:hypothetical protein